MKSELEAAEGQLRRSLSDVGCDVKTMEAIVKMQQSGDTDRMAAALNRFRRTLLERVHAEQHRIDCLDFLLNDLAPNATSRRKIKK